MNTRDKTGGLHRLHYFCPENDAALAANVTNYTAPAAAVRLRRAGSALSMWYGSPGDRFVTDGINARWYECMRDTFGIDVDVYDGCPDRLVPAPWGWSPAVRRRFADLGFTAEALPDDVHLDAIRALSHRRTALTITDMLRQHLGDIIAPPGREIDDVETAISLVCELSHAMVKQPWSSSGRGVFDSALFTPDDLQRHIHGTIRHQGSVIVEPFHDSTTDLALLFEVSHGHAEYLGPSVFDTDSHNAYFRSIVATADILNDILDARAGRHIITESLTNALGEIIATVIGTTYDGPVGVDFLALPDGRLAVCEMNLRNSMGHIALSLGSHILAPGTVAEMTVRPTTPQPIPADILSTAEISNGRLLGGTLGLVPPDETFAFLLTTTS